MLNKKITYIVDCPRSVNFQNLRIESNFDYKNPEEELLLRQRIADKLYTKGHINAIAREASYEAYIRPDITNDANAYIHAKMDPADIKKEFEKEKNTPWYKAWEKLTKPFTCVLSTVYNRAFDNDRYFSRHDDTFSFQFNESKCINIYRHEQPDLPGCIAYVGKYKDCGDPHGEGTCYGIDGKIIYYGEFKDGRPTGKYPMSDLHKWGKYSFGKSNSTTGNVYVGESINNQWGGYGILVVEKEGFYGMRWRYYNQKTATITEYLYDDGLHIVHTELRKIDWTAMKGKSSSSSSPVTTPKPQTPKYAAVLTNAPILFGAFSFNKAWSELGKISMEKVVELRQELVQRKSVILVFNVSKEEAERWKTTLEMKGGKVEIKQVKQ